MSSMTETRRPILGVSTPRPQFTHAMPAVQPPRKVGPKGHDVYLKNFQDRKCLVDVFVASGDRYRGVIENRDRYTITIRPLIPGVAGAGETRLSKGVTTIYKSAVESFAEVVTE